MVVFNIFRPAIVLHGRHHISEDKHTKNKAITLRRQLSVTAFVLDAYWQDIERYIRSGRQDLWN
jgi:hypothetical protein